MRIRRLIWLIVSVAAPALALLLAGRAAADMAPLPQAAASSVMPGQGTHVQMRAEQVVLDAGGLATRVPVTADFTMRNLGTTVEDMPVRFPLAYPTEHEGSPAGYGNEIRDLRAAVERTEVATRTEVFDGTPWAVWTVRFPPGQDVHVRVTYTTRPVDWGAYADLYYILETGAGWNGPIGRGDIIFRFPYSADPEMIVTSEAGHLPYYPSSTPKFVTEGNELRWHFEDLKPTPHDNVALSVLYPAIWQAILAGRRRLEQEPGNASAYTALGRAYQAAIPIKNWWPREGSGLALHFGPLAEAALRRGAELARSSVDAHLALAEFLVDHAWNIPPEPWYSDARREIARVLQLDPGNQQAVELSRYLDAIASTGILTPGPAATETVGTAEPAATAAPAAEAASSTPEAQQAPAGPSPASTAVLPTTPAGPVKTTAAATAPAVSAGTASAASTGSGAAPGQAGGQLPCAGGAAVLVAALLVTAAARFRFLLKDG